MPHRASAPRRGLTLLELLVVLVIMGIAGGLVLSGQAARTAPERRAALDDQWRMVVDSARTLAIQRQGHVRLRLYDDGVWSIGAPGSNEPLAAGEIGAPPLSLDLSVDARGTCRPSAGWSPPLADDVRFDAGRCRWVSP